MRKLRVRFGTVSSRFFSTTDDPHFAASALKAASTVVVAGHRGRWPMAADLAVALRGTLMRIDRDGTRARNFGVCGNYGYRAAPGAATVYYFGKGVDWPLVKQFRRAGRPDVIAVTNVAGGDRIGWKLMEHFGLLSGSRWRLAAEDDSVSLIRAGRYIGTYPRPWLLAAMDEP